MCDVSCQEAGDCCLDYEFECHDGQNTNYDVQTQYNISLYEEMIQSRSDLASFVTCFKVQVSQRRKTSVFGVASCPEDTEINLKQKCEDSSSNNTDIMMITPVSNYIHAYKNIYCARCHGRNTSSLNIWKPNFSCQNTTTLRLVLAMEGVSGLVKHVLLSGECVTHFSLPPRGLFLLCDNIVRSCPPQYISDAPEGTLNERTLVVKACVSYSSLFRSRTSSAYRDIKLYKNVYCALCNNIPVPKILLHFKLHCQIEFFSGYMQCLPCEGPPPSFAVLLDYFGSYKLTESKLPEICRQDQIKKPNDDCLEINCMKGFYLSALGECVQMKNEKELPNHTNHIYVTITISKTRNESFGNNSFIERVASTFSVTEITDLVTCPENKKCVQFSYQGELTSDITRELKKVLKREKSGNILINATTYKDRDNLSCTSLFESLPWVDELRENRSDVIQNKRIGVSVGKMENDSEITETWWHETCSDNITKTCPMVKLDLDWYLVIDGSIKIKKTGKILESNDFRWVNRTLYVCSELFLKLFRNKTKLLQDLYLQGYLTIIGQTLSMFGLGSTILVYGLLPSLRTVPGRALMNLCIALFLAQLLFQTSAYLTIWPVVCHVVGALQHFAWLSSFSWMTCLAGDIAKTFSRLTIIQNKVPSRFLWLAFLSWGLPAIFVAICVTIDHYEVFDISYVSKYGCWIQTDLGLQFFFAIPVGCMLVTNMILFVLSVFGLRRATNATSSVKTDEQRQKADRDRFLAYLKLSSMMGFGWIFGFLANFTSVNEFWYVFIILSSTQGIFVFLSFAFSREIFDQIGVKYGIACLKRAPCNASSGNKLSTGSSVSSAAVVETTNL